MQSPTEEELEESIKELTEYKNRLEKELVTSDLLPLMKHFSKHEKSLIENSLQLSDMIEFAKHTENDNKFKQITSEFSKIVRKEKI